MALEDKLDYIRVSDLGNRTKPKILFYDIETTPIKAWIWKLGEQVVLHHQLDDKYNQYGIICVAYKWNDNSSTKIIHWDYNKQDTEKVVREFDKIAEEADVVIGKNSDRFDVKHINAQRMLKGMSLPSWLLTTDDLESQFRRNFYLPSYSLDYLSKTILKNKGKDKMEFDDWIDIVERRNKRSYDKMLTYCKHDVEHTADLWKFASKHFKPKLNQATFKVDVCCANCGSNNIKRNGTRVRGKTIYQMYFCNEHGGYAGQAPISIKTGKIGKIGL